MCVGGEFWCVFVEIVANLPVIECSFIIVCLATWLSGAIAIDWPFGVTTTFARSLSVNVGMHKQSLRERAYKLLVELI